MEYDISFLTFFLFFVETLLEEQGLEAFVFLEVEIYFEPKHGDVACFKPSQFLHCTRRLNLGNLLGLAFFQKGSLYRQLGQLLFPTSPGFIHYKAKKGVPTNIETKEGFLKKRSNYKENVSNSALSIANFMVSSFIPIYVRRL